MSTDETNSRHISLNMSEVDMTIKYHVVQRLENTSIALFESLFMNDAIRIIEEDFANNANFLSGYIRRPLVHAKCPDQIRYYEFIHAGRNAYTRFIIRQFHLTEIEAYLGWSVAGERAAVFIGVWLSQHYSFDLSAMVAVQNTSHCQTNTPHIDNQSAELTRRECEVADLLADRHSRKEIAAKLMISPDTVKTHLWNIAKRWAFDTTAIHALGAEAQRRGYGSKGAEG